MIHGCLNIVTIFKPLSPICDSLQGFLFLKHCISGRFGWRSLNFWKRRGSVIIQFILNILQQKQLQNANNIQSKWVNSIGISTIRKRWLCKLEEEKIFFPIFVTILRSFFRAPISLSLGVVSERRFKCKTRTTKITEKIFRRVSANKVILDGDFWRFAIFVYIPVFGLKT